MKTNTLTSELLCGMHSYWRAANYLSVGQIYLYDNPLLRDPLKLSCEAPGGRAFGYDARSDPPEGKV